MLAKIKDFFKNLALKERSSHKLSLSLCVGIYIAFSPFPGFHTMMVFMLSWLMSLNFGIVLASSIAVNNPWTMVPVYGAGHVFGRWLCVSALGVGDMSTYNPTWVSSFNDWIAQYIGMPAVSLWAFIIGGNILGIALALIFYPIFFWFFSNVHREEEKKI